MTAERYGLGGLAWALVFLGACASAGDKAGAATADLTSEEKLALEAMSPATLPAPPADVSNRLADDASAAAFGQTLFFETAFSGALLDGDNNGTPVTLGNMGDIGKVACAGCHLPRSGFLDTRSANQQISLAAGWGTRRTPSLLDIGQQRLLMWDSSRDAFHSQVFGPLESPAEMNSSRLFVAEQIFKLYRTDYEKLFGPLPPLDDATRFPPLLPTQTGCQRLAEDEHTCLAAMRGSPGDGAEYDALPADDQIAVTRVIANMGKALGAFQRLLTCGTSRFDRWMHGDSSALTAEEQSGAKLFVGKAKCATCHSGPFLTDRKYHDVGLLPATVAVVFRQIDDHGAKTGLARALADPVNTKSQFSDGYDDRLPADVPDSLDGAFRTPGLRCVTLRPSFMRTGQLMSLEKVIEFFDRGGDNGGFIGQKELVPLGLTEEERGDLLAFLKALDGPGPAEALLGPP